MICRECNGRGETTYYVETHRDENSVTVKARKGVCRSCNGSGEEPMTNADRIRGMSDEELVAWAKKQIGCGFDYFPCGVVCDGNCETYTDEECRAKIMKWLQQPAEVQP